MTEQCVKAMQVLYAQEARTASNVEKARIDEALDQLLEQHSSTQAPSWLLRNAVSNAKKKVERHYNRIEELNEDCHPAPMELEAPAIEWADTVTRAGLSPRQLLILHRCGQGYSIPEIAQECGITNKSVYRSRQRARVQLREYLASNNLYRTR